MDNLPFSVYLIKTVWHAFKVKKKQKFYGDKAFIGNDQIFYRD